MSSRRSRTRAVIVGAFLFVLASGSTSFPRADEAVVATLRAATGALLTAPDDSVKQLTPLLDSAEAAPFHDIVLFSLASAERERDPAGAVARLRSLLELHPDSPLAARASAALLDLETTAPVDTTSLSSRLEHYVAGDLPRQDVAAFALRVGKRIVAADPQAAADALMHARRVGKGDTSARESAKALETLRAANPQLAPANAEAYLHEARLCSSEGNPEAQARWLDRLLAGRPTGSRLHEALIMRARVIASTKGRPAAADWLDAHAKEAASRTAKASLLFAAANQRWNADQDDRAIAAFNGAIELHPTGKEAQEARYAIGRIHQSHSRHTAAIEAFRRAADGPDVALAAESRWRAGWSSYLAGNFEAAEREFAAMVARYPGKEPRSARESALYWQARSSERRGNVETARPLYERVVREFPDGYYSYLVERRIGLSAPAPSPSAIESTAPIAGDAKAKLSRIGAFDAIGYGGAAAVEVHRLLKHANDPQKRSLLPELARVGAHSAALKTALALYHRNAITEAELYPFFYPIAFSDLVERESTEHRIDPYLVYALMKQESLFDRHAVSPASAYGLMQLLLSTARRMAGEPEASKIGVEILFDPETNIRLGTAYLAELSRLFRGETVFMLAGYNAGERAAETWRARFGALDVDELVERITYRETRDYVKKVLANYRNYSRLYPRA
jgi:soluble lytic murein transglycosylase-like protein